MRISIIIPSRERGRYLAHSLRTCTDIDDPDLEILVSDNASTDNTEAVVRACTDPRVRYVNTGARLSMRQNFEFALGQSTGDYVIMFGDDDGILPGQFPYLRRILEDQGPDTLSWAFLTYGWPVEGVAGKPGGMRFRKSTSFGLPKVQDPASCRADASAARLEGPRTFPALYHGCMSRAFLERCRAADGMLFLARSPDIYISYRALLSGGKFLHSDHPFSINGFSPASTGGNMRDVGQNEKDTKDTRFIQEARIDPVDDIIPITWSMSLAYFGTLQTALHHFPDATIQPDFRAWYARALVDMAHKDPATAALIDQSLKDHAKQFGAQDALAAARSARAVVKTRLSRLIEKARGWRGSLRRSSAIDGENTIHTAARMADAILGDDMGRVLTGTATPAQSWANVRARAAQFDKQL